MNHAGVRVKWISVQVSIPVRKVMNLLTLHGTNLKDRVSIPVRKVMNAMLRGPW